jgi:hypothetical protein
MPRGSAVIPYRGKRGGLADWHTTRQSQQIMETLNSGDRWTRTKAQRALGAAEAHAVCEAAD